MQEAGTVAATEQEERAVAGIRLKRPLHMVRNAEKAPGQTKGSLASKSGSGSPHINTQSQESVVSVSNIYECNSFLISFSLFLFICFALFENISYLLTSSRPSSMHSQLPKPPQA